eukprot:GHVU01129461.1.p1 GENE.GHVU01129461.1~~GHVU01129461.1.p1  ORF type:complete len:247 (+),score=29.70 GHVU01129461.1:59-742(+)
MEDTERVAGRRDRRNKGGQIQVASASAEDDSVSVAPRFGSEIEREVSDVGRPQPKGASPQKPLAAKGLQKTHGFMSTNKPLQRLGESAPPQYTTASETRTDKPGPKGTQIEEFVDDIARARESITRSDTGRGAEDYSDIQTSDLSDEGTSYESTEMGTPTTQRDTTGGRDPGKQRTEFPQPASGSAQSQTPPEAERLSPGTSKRRGYTHTGHDRFTPHRGVAAGNSP